jgi:flavin-binding protein dodecin
VIKECRDLLFLKPRILLVIKMPFVKIIDTVGSSPESWEEAAKNAIEDASKLPIFKQKSKITKATIKDFDVKIEDNKIAAYLCRVEMFLE